MDDKVCNYKCCCLQKKNKVVEELTIKEVQFDNNSYPSKQNLENEKLDRKKHA